MISQSPSQAKVKTCLILLLLLGSLAFWPALDNEFTNWDDPEYITNNSVVQNLSLENTKRLFTTFQVYFYHPLTLLSFSIEYALVGQKPALFHTNNVLIHLLNTVLAFLLLRRLSGNTIVAFTAGLLFAIHPMRVESVAWISGRKDVLATLFFLSALLTYSAGSHQKSWLRWSGTFFLALCGFLSKPSLLMFPLILLLIDYLKQRSWSLALILEKTPFFLLSLTSGWVAIQAQQAFGAMSQPHTPWTVQQLLLSGHIFTFYLYKLFWPTQLSVAYNYPELAPGSFPLWLIGSCACTLAFAAFIVHAWRRNHRLIVFGGLWYLFAISPNLQFVPVGNMMAYDRYTYIPALGIFLGLALAVDSLYNKMAETLSMRRLFASVLLIVAVILILMTRSQCDVWQNSVLLYGEVLRVNPIVGVHLLVNRGKAYMTHGQFDLAVADFQRYLKLFPSGSLSPTAHEGLGIAFSHTGKHDQAEEEFRKALQVPESDKATILRSRGITLNYLGRMDEAIKDFSQALLLTPEDPDLWFNRGLAWEQLGSIPQAVVDYSQAIRFNPKMMEAWKNRGVLHQEIGSSSQALNDFQEALRLAPHHAPNLFNLGLWKARQKQLSEAADCFLQALNYDPKLFVALAARSECLMALKKADLALVELQNARSRWGESPEILLPMFYVHKRMQNTSEARILAQELLLASPSAAVEKELRNAIR